MFRAVSGGGFICIILYFSIKKIRRHGFLADSYATCSTKPTLPQSSPFLLHFLCVTLASSCSKYSGRTSKIAAILKKFSIVKGSQLFSILLSVMRDIPNSFAISSCLMPRAVRYEPISTPNSKSSSEKSSSPTSCA